MLRNRNHYTISCLAAHRFKKISINIEKSAQIDVSLAHACRSQEHVYFHRRVRVHPRQLGHQQAFLKNCFHVERGVVAFVADEEEQRKTTTSRHGQPNVLHAKALGNLRHQAV